MIKLKLKRDKLGRYILDADEIFALYQVYENDGKVFGENSEYAISCSISDKTGKYFIKERDGEDAITNAVGELLFAKCCEKNGIRCADVDIGVFENELCIISKDVSQKGEMCFNYTMSKIANSYVEKCVFGEVDSTVRDYEDFLKRASRFFAVEPTQNIREILDEKVLIDFLCGQEDFNAGGMMVNINLIDSTLKILPFFDNEYSFCFDVGFESLSGEQKRRVACGEFDEGIERAMHKTSHQIESDNYPSVGILSKTDIYPLEDFGFENGEETQFGSFVDELAHEILQHPQLKKFYDNLNLDFESMAEEIKAETGFSVGKFFVKYAEFVAKTRKNMLNNALERAQQSSSAEKGQ